MASAALNPEQLFITGLSSSIWFVEKKSLVVSAFFLQRSQYIRLDIYILKKTQNGKCGS